jgi:hypothetical protein
MLSSRSCPRGVGLGVVVVVVTGLGADPPTQTIDAGGLTFQAPASWKSSPPRSSMRRAQLKVEPVQGDEDPAELVVFAFPGGAGGVEANVKRWQEQFRDADGNAPKVASKTVKGKNVDVTRVEIAGHYVAAEFPGSPKKLDKPNYHLLGAIVLTDSTGYFLKMVGPEKTMVAARPAFDALIASAQVRDK